MADQPRRVKLAVPVIVQGRQRSPGDEVEVSADDAERFERKGWTAKPQKHTSTRAKGGPTPKGESKPEDGASKGKDEGAEKAKPSKSKSKPSKG